MDMSESEAGRSTPAETESSLIPGLLDDASLCCIARVPRRYHAWLSCVSKGWRDLVRSQEWLEYRKKHGLQETWIYVMYFRNFLQVHMIDPSDASMRWKRVRFDSNNTVIPTTLEALGKKIYTVGGADRVTRVGTDNVDCYDASTSNVSRAPSLPRPRHSHICEVLNGKLYAIGGFGSEVGNRPLPSQIYDMDGWARLSDNSVFDVVHQPEAGHIAPLPSDVYDPGTNSWTCLSDNNIFDLVHQSVVMDGKIYVRGRGRGRGGKFTGIHVGAYDPSSNMWELADLNFRTGWKSLMANVDGDVYTFNMEGNECTKWDREERMWVVVGKLPDGLMISKSVVAIGKTAYIIDGDLNMLIIHLDQATGNPESILPYTVFENAGDLPMLWSIRCTCLAI